LLKPVFWIKIKKMLQYQKTPKSKAIRIGTIAPRCQRSKKNKQELGLAEKEFIICPDCNCVFFDKAWHHSLDEDVKHIRESKSLKFKICPACRMKRDRTFEGELVIELSKEKPSEKKEIMNIIKNSDQQAQAHDPMDRILWTENKNNETRVFTSENQLAVRIGKKLKSSFKGSVLEIKHSHEEDVIRVRWKH